jgi:hypothetical protein
VNVSYGKRDGRIAMHDSNYSNGTSFFFSSDCGYSEAVQRMGVYVRTKLSPISSKVK